MSSGHAAVVLAAGGSTRLGRPKQLFTRDGEALVHRVVRLAAATGPRRLLVVTGAASDAVARVLRDLPGARIDNPRWQTGMAGSLAAAAVHLAGHDGPVLVLACDQPALEATHLQALLDGAHASASGCAACLHGALPGIPAVVPGHWFADIASATEGGDRGFGTRLRELPASTRMDLHAPELSLDVDTPQDLDDAVARGWVDR